MVRASVVSVVLLIGLVACSGEASSSSRDAGAQVVTTTSVLADVVAELVGEHGSVQSLMETGADPHDFTPSADQASLLRSADLVVANGLGLEGGLVDMLESVREDGATVVELAELVDPIPFGTEHEDNHDGEEAHPDHAEHDPHFTLDPLRMADAMDAVADALSQHDDSTDWEERAAGVRAELEALHREIEEELSVVPAERRKLVTNHDALGYFAERYGFEVIGTVIPGGSTLAEPSASDLAELAELLRREAITVVFADTTDSTGLADTVAAEAGEDVDVHHLYTGSLGPEGSGAETYFQMMRSNASTIAAALGS